MKEFKFKGTDQSSYTADIVTQHLLNFIIVPTSVLDIGCGIGTWSKVLRDKGVSKNIMLDHPSNQKKNLLFPNNEFHLVDMNKELPPVFPVDLVVCIEVLEHLKPNRSETIINYISQCTNTVLFSAAIPGQGGIGHINMHYSNYWESIFQMHGFKKYDILRPLIIKDDKMEYFIRQNVFLYEREGGLLISRKHSDFIPPDFELIHRKVLDKHVSPIALIKKIPSSLIQSIKNRLGKI